MRLIFSAWTVHCHCIDILVLLCCKILHLHLLISLNVRLSWMGLRPTFVNHVLLGSNSLAQAPCLATLVQRVLRRPSNPLKSASHVLQALGGIGSMCLHVLALRYIILSRVCSLFFSKTLQQLIYIPHSEENLL